MYMEDERDGDTNCNCYILYTHQTFASRTGELWNKRTMETIQTRPEYCEESLRQEESCCHSDTSKNPTYAGVKNSQKRNNNNNVKVIHWEICKNFKFDHTKK